MVTVGTLKLPYLGPATSQNGCTMLIALAQLEAV